jgi:hypothetical protein
MIGAVRIVITTAAPATNASAIKAKMIFLFMKLS